MKVKPRFYLILILLALVCYALYTKPQEPQSTRDNPLIAEKEKEKKITISFVGDILLASHVENIINQRGITYPFEMVRSTLLESDLAMGNLESAVGLSGTANQGKKYTFRASPKVLEGVRWAGIDILSVANNHILDFGTEAFVETLNNIDSARLYYVGAGKDDSQAYSPLVFNKDGKRLAYFSASRVVPSGDWHAGRQWRGVATVYNPARLINEMRQTRREVDFIAVYLHWGTERETAPEPYQRKLAKQLIDNGADVVIGSHPHVLQGFEYYKGKLIAYSLGNFVFTNLKNETMILKLSLSEDGNQIAQVIPCIIKNYRPEIVEDEAQRAEFYRMLEERSFGVKVEDGFVYNNVRGE